MNDQRDQFDHRQSRGQRCVENDREADDGNGQERSVPRLVPVHLIVQDDQALKDRPGNKRNAGQEDLPPCGTEPSFG